MPKPEDLRPEMMHTVRCNICDLPLRAPIPNGVTGRFFHPSCIGFDVDEYERQQIDRGAQTPAA